MESNFNLRGVFLLEHRDVEGALKSSYLIDNTITTVGKQEVVSFLRGNRTAAFKYLAIGSSSTAAVVGNTALAAEITSPSLKRIAGTSTAATTNVSNDTSQLVHTWSSTATQSVREIGVFDTGTSGGTLISRATFTVKNLVSGDTLQATHKIVVS